MKIVNFTDDDLFYRYDKGWAVRAKSLAYTSHQPRASDRYAHWFVQAVGDATVPSTQDIGVADYETRTEASLTAELKRGGTYLRANLVSGETPAVGWELGVRELDGGPFQGLGRVAWLVVLGSTLHVRFDVPADYTFPVGARVYFYAPAAVASDNLFIPRRMPVRIAYDYPQGLAGPRPAAVAVQRRDTRRGKSSYFFPAQVAEVAEGEAVVLDGGYYAFVACHPLEDVEVDVDGELYTHHYNAAAAPFSVIVEGAPAGGYLLREDLTTRNEPQAADLYSSCGKSTLCRAGVPVKVNDGRPLSTRGEIFLCRRAADTYVGWNDFGFDERSRTYFPQCKLGTFAGGVVHKVFVDRWGESWCRTPGYELEGGVTRYGNALYGGRRGLARNWVRTGLQIIWAAPPQEFAPDDYDGGRAAAFMVPGDRRELFAAGDIIRLAPTAAAEPLPKEYVIAEVGAGARLIAGDSPYALDDSWRGVTAVFTWVVMLDVGREYKTYAAQVRAEVLGKYIAVAKGEETRHEVWRFDL